MRVSDATPVKRIVCAPTFWLAGFQNLSPLKTAMLLVAVVDVMLKQQTYPVPTSQFLKGRAM